MVAIMGSFPPPPPPTLPPPPPPPPSPTPPSLLPPLSPPHPSSKRVHSIDQPPSSLASATMANSEPGPAHNWRTRGSSAVRRAAPSGSRALHHGHGTANTRIHPPSVLPVKCLMDHRKPVLFPTAHLRDCQSRRLAILGFSLSWRAAFPPWTPMLPHRCAQYWHRRRRADLTQYPPSRWPRYYIILTSVRAARKKRRHGAAAFDFETKENYGFRC